MLEEDVGDRWDGSMLGIAAQHPHQRCTRPVAEDMVIRLGARLQRIGDVALCLRKHTRHT